MEGLGGKIERESPLCLIWSFNKLATVSSAQKSEICKGGERRGQDKVFMNGAENPEQVPSSCVAPGPGPHCPSRGLPLEWPSSLSHPFMGLGLSDGCLCCQQCVWDSGGRVWRLLLLLWLPDNVCRVKVKYSFLI